MSEVCNISIKYSHSNKSAKKAFLHKIPYNPFQFKKRLRFPSHKFSETFLTTFSLFLVLIEMRYISNKYWILNISAKKRNLYASHLTRIFHFGKKFCDEEYQTLFEIKNGCYSYYAKISIVS